MRSTLELIRDFAEMGIAETNDLKRQIEVLAIHHETKAEAVYSAAGGR